MRSRWALVALFGVVAAAAVALLALRRDRGLSGEAWAALREGNALEIVSLDPDRSKPQAPDKLYWWNVLGRAKVASPDQRVALLDALEKGLEEPLPYGPSGCFNPRHALSVSHRGHKYDVLVCFECGHVYWYVDGAKQESLVVGGSQYKVFDAVFTDAGLPIAP